MNVGTITTVIVFVINIIGLISVVFIERKNASTAIAWILAIVFLPIIGLLMYVLFGTTYFMRDHKHIDREQARDALVMKTVQEQLDRCSDMHVPIEASKYENILKLNRNDGEAVVRPNNNLKVYIDANVKYADLFADLKAAKETINIIYFIIQADSYSKTFIDILTERAQNGVEVRLMYDVNASNHTPKAFFKEFIAAGGKLGRFLPSPLSNFLRINYRLHRKIVVIDGNLGYVGGMNIGNEYASMKPSISPWRDTHLRVTGDAVYDLQSRFMRDWFHFTRENINDVQNIERFFAPARDAGTIPIQIVSSGPDMDDMQIYDAMISMVNSAKRVIKIQTPYFIPDDAFMQALKLAAKSGIDIQIMIPGIPDKPAVYDTTLSFIEETLPWGATIYRHKGFVHAKTIVIDDEICTIGSCNIDNRSFGLDFEINAFIYDEAFAKEYSAIFEQDKNDCTIITQADFDRIGFWKRVFTAITRLFAPLM